MASRVFHLESASREVGVEDAEHDVVLCQEHGMDLGWLNTRIGQLSPVQ